MENSNIGKRKLNRSKIQSILKGIKEENPEKINKILKAFEESAGKEISKECEELERKNPGIIEFIGKRVKVVASSSTFKNVSGMIIWETKNTFKIITVHKKKKVLIDVPKKGNIFELSLKGERFVIKGDEINYSPIERAKRMRKWKV